MRSRCRSCPARLPLVLPPAGPGVPQCCEGCGRLVPLWRCGPDGDREMLCRRCAEAGDWMGTAIPRLCGACGRHVAVYWQGDADAGGPTGIDAGTVGAPPG